MNVRLTVLGLVLVLAGACGASERAAFTLGPEGASDDGGGTFAPAGDAGDETLPDGRDPVTCDEARRSRSYVGCDYWPTVTPNDVEPFFDFAVIVANIGEEAANVAVTGPNGVEEHVTVAPSSLEKIFLPWVDDLHHNGQVSSAFVKAGAYHLVSSRPVVAYQFNPLEYKASGGPPGKDWKTPCKGYSGDLARCLSHTNDASLLLPSTAMTGNYRVMASAQQERTRASYFVVTATEDATKVTLKLGAKAQIVEGGGITATPSGGTMKLSLDAGDVALIATDLDFKGGDTSGTLVVADKPVQVISGSSCSFMPNDDDTSHIQTCDHLEETVFPAESLGRHYVVTRPTGPQKNDVSAVVRLFGNVDGTTLTYKPSMPPGCPEKLAAGEVAACGRLVSVDFEVTGDHEFGIAIFMLNGSLVDSHYDPAVNYGGPIQGDPSQSFAVAVEQYRKRYVFLAPADYDSGYVDVVGPQSTTLQIDGKDASSQFKKLSGTDWFVARIELAMNGNGTTFSRQASPWASRSSATARPQATNTQAA